MTEKSQETVDRPPVGTLVDFVDGVDENNPLDVEITINQDGRVILFYDKPFKRELSWFEYDIDESKLDFVLSDGEIRDAGVPLKRTIGKHMQNTHQILTVLMNDKTGDPIEGNYIPLIIHQK